LPNIDHKVLAYTKNIYFVAIFPYYKDAYHLNKLYS